MSKLNRIKILCIVLVITTIFGVLPSVNATPVSNANINNVTNDSVNPNDVESESIYIEKELPELRTEYSKTFKRSDGTKEVVVAAEALHYQETEDSNWEEIENQLTTEGENLVNNKNEFKVKLPKSLDNKTPVSIEKDGYSVSFKLLNKVNKTNITHKPVKAKNKKIEQLNKAEKMNKTAYDVTDVTVRNDVVSYDNVIDNTNIKYDIQPKGLKESIILNNKPTSELKYTYEIKSKGLSAILSDNKEIYFYRSDEINLKNKKAVFVMPAPFMTDSNNAYSDDITISLNPIKDGYELIYAPSDEWLSSSERKYPCVIDPTINTSTSTSNILDTYKYTGSTSACGTETKLVLGTSGASSSSSVLVKIGLGSLPEGIIITKSNLNMYVNSVSGSSNAGVKQITNSWTEIGVTGSTSISTKYGYLDMINISSSDTPVDSWAQWDITNTLSDWVHGREVNNGLLISNYYSSEPGCQFASKESSDSSKRPFISIEYKDYDVALGSHRTIDAGRAGEIYVDDITGSLMVKENDIGFDGNIMPVDINMIYSTNERNTRGISTSSGMPLYGSGFSTNYSQTLKFFGDYYLYVAEDGAKIRFEKDVSETDPNSMFIDSSGRELKLQFELNSDGTVSNYYDYSKIYIKDANGFTYRFNSSNGSIKDFGCLISIEDNSPKKSLISISYDYGNNNISQIIDGAGRIYNFIYSNYNLYKIEYLGAETSSVKATVSYEISDGYGSYKTITYPDGKKVKYEYISGTKLIGTIINTDSTNTIYSKYEFTYTNTSRPQVASIKTYGLNGVLGQNVSVSYTRNTTTYLDNNTGKKEIIQYDNNGNVTNVQDSDGNAVYGSYDNSGSSSNAPDKLVSISGLQKSTNNMVKNPQAERSGDWSIPSSGTISSEEKMFGNSSFKLTNTTNTSTSSFSQSISGLSSANVYTFSAYVKTTNVTNTSTNSRAKLKVSGQGLQIINESNEPLKLGDSDWKRIYVTFTGPASVSLYLSFDYACGNAYFDGVQLEKGSYMSRLNLLENGGFNNAGSNWSGAYTYTSTYGGYDAGPHAGISSSITGAYTIYQNVSVNGTSGDTFTFGGWGKSSYALPLRDDRTFEIKAQFYNGSSPVGDAQSISFNPLIKDWQYVMSGITAEGDYTSIRVEFRYDYQYGYGYCDDMQLYKEPFGVNFEYDDEGNLISSTEVEETPAPPADIDNPDLSNPTSSKAKTEYDEYDRVIEDVSAEGVGTTYNYDKYNNALVERITNGRVSMEALYNYDEYSGNYLRSVKDASGDTTYFTYNTQSGQLLNKYNENNEKDVYTYDNLISQNPSQISRAVSSLYNDGTNPNQIAVNYSYDKSDRLSGITHNGSNYAFNYDPFGVLKNIKVGSRDLVTYNYGGFDKDYILNNLTYGNGQIVNYNYDSSNNLTGISFGGLERFKYLYDNMGQSTCSFDYINNIKTLYEVNGDGSLVTKRTGINGNNYSHEYFTSADNIFEETINGKVYKTELVIDKDGRSNGIKYSPVTGVTTGAEITYDDLGRITSEYIHRTQNSVTNNILQVKYGYDELPDYKTTPQVKFINLYNNSGFNKSLNYQYEFGRITKANDITYEYDEAGQLKRVNDPVKGTTAYVYDKGGNIRSVSKYNYTPKGTALGSPTSTINYGYNDSEWKDLLTSYKGYGITYDTIGNPIYYRDTNYRFDWEMGRQLSKVYNDKGTRGTTTDDTLLYSYTYDDNGLRQSKTKRVGTTDVKTTFTWADGNMTHQTDGTNELYFRYDSDGSIVGFDHTYNNVTKDYYYVKNLQGDIIAILDNTGALVAEYEYDAIVSV